jgi:NAD(P)-dependent dehydrogenase (short-subunit alcohol dehydrogenase family)
MSLIQESWKWLISDIKQTMTKNIIISGISSGIGKHLASRLSKQGYNVIGTVRNEADKERLLKEHPALHVLICDICKDDEVDACILELKSVLGDQGLFALINNAGIAIPGPMHMVPDEVFERQLNVNLIATRKLTNKILPFLTDKQQALEPRIIFMSSVSGVFAAPFNGSYCVSKHGLECMIDVYRRELKYLGIKVISVLPGPIKTRIWEKARGQFEAYKKGVYKSIAERADEIINATETTALPVERLGEVVEKILLINRPKNRYFIKKNLLLFKLVAYILPSSWVDKLVWKNLEKKDTKKYRPV